MTNPKPLSADELLGHGLWLRRLAERLVGDDRAPDLVQETWIAALQQRPRALVPWLRRVLHNLAVSDVRARSRRRARERVHARPEALPSAGELAARAETTRLLAEAILRLKPVQRDVILLRFFDELPPARIAEHLGLPGATVRSHIARAIACLRRDLDAGSGGDRARWTRALSFLPAQTATSKASTLCAGLLMTTTQKTAASVLVVLAGIGFLCWPSDAPGGGSAADAVTPSGKESLAVPASAPVAQDGSGAGDGSARRLVAAGPHDPGDPGTVSLRCVDARTGASVPHATVLHVARGFDWESLDAESKEEYSLSTESFLRRCGESLEADQHGFVELPAYGAHSAIVGRRGELFGSQVARPTDGPWTLTLAPHHELLVEVVHASGRPAPGIRVVRRIRPSAFQPFAAVTPLGTTDAAGRVRHSLPIPLASARDPVLSIFASLPGAEVGAFELDPAHPPSGPVRIVLPPVGSVTVRILDPLGGPLDPRGIADPHVELAAAEADPATLSGPFGAERHRARIEDDGCARFATVPVGGDWTIRAPALLGLRCAGPAGDGLEVLVEHRMHPDHPLLVGRLVDARGQSIANERFSIQCRSGVQSFAMVGGITDEQGVFEAYLPETLLGKTVDEVVIGMDWRGTEPEREARVVLRGPLIGRTPVGDVALP